MVDSILFRIEESARKGDWASATAAAERALACVAHGMVAGDVVLVDAIANGAPGGASRIVLEHDVESSPSPVAVAWLLKAAAAVAEAARGQMRRPDDGDTRTLILGRLGVAGTVGMTTSELASACGRSVETVSRMLPVLRGTGEVETKAVGRHKRNWLAGVRETRIAAFDAGAEHEEAADALAADHGDGGTDAVTTGEVIGSAIPPTLDRFDHEAAENDRASVLNFQPA